MTSREVFCLTLYSASTQPYVQNATLYGATQYLVNWDALFNGRNKFYKNCGVRIRLNGNGEIAKSSISNATGYISLIGLGYNRSVGNEVPGLVIGPLDFAQASVISAAETGYYLKVDTTASVCAPQITAPQGITSMTVLMTQENGAQMGNANLSPYTITLCFELTDPIEPLYPQESLRMR